MFAAAFATVGMVVKPGASTRPFAAPSISRHEVLGLAPAAALAFASAFTPLPSLASGGATAGRTTSIPNAKRRYFKRVTADVSSFLDVGRSVSADNAAAAKSAAFWSDKDVGFDDLTNAGYLLAVAFKIDARVPPQRIQQKRDHDAMIASITKLKKSVGSSDTAAAKALYADALEKLETYLKGVELPPTSDSSAYQ